MEKKLDQFLKSHNKFQTLHVSASDRAELVRIINEDYFQQCLTSIIAEVEEIVNIDPTLSKEKILGQAAEIIVKAMQAEAVTIRLLDPTSLKMLAFGASGLDDYRRMASIPANESIAGKVVQENRSIPVPSIAKDPFYKDKNIVAKKGYNSLLAIPLHIPRFSEMNSDIFGSMQIYYRLDDRQFSPLEITYAELLSRRVCFVLANKKILDLQKLNQRKGKISDKIFIKISNREGIKLKDFFILIIPELEKFLQVRNCTLFSISNDLRHIQVEAAYPLDLIYHETGYSYTVDHHFYFSAAIHGGMEYGDNPFERVDPAYLLIKDPLKSSLITKGIRDFAQQHQIYSILMIPLKVDGQIKHLLFFYAGDQKKFFTDEEIELLIFFGKEIIKASKLEFFSDVLHDLKNPAVAVAGLAARARKLLDREKGNLDKVASKLTTYLDVVASETIRLQDIVMTMSGEDREELVDLGEVSLKRFHINEAAIRESKRTDIVSSAEKSVESLPVFCSLFGLERILDNLLHNATKAIPLEGGTLTLHCYREKAMVCLRIENTGEIPADQIEQIRCGDVRGRGLNIIRRFIQSNHGIIDIQTKNGQTVFTIKLLLHEPGQTENRQI